MSAPYRPWEVTLLVTRRVKFVVDARNIDEAETTAGEYFADGEEGISLGAPVVEVEETLPVEELTSDELFKSDASGFHA